IINETSVAGSLLNLRAHEIQKHALPIDNGNSTRIIDQVNSVIKTLIRSVYAPVLGIAVATPGIVDSHNGTVQLATHLKWKNFPLGQELTKRFKLPVYVGNDSNLIMLGEHRFGIAQEGRDLIVVKIDTGIGVGILSDGRIIYGDNNSAGEIG